MTFFFPLFPGWLSHPIHNPLTFISECKDTIKIFYLQEKNKEKCQNYNNATIFYVFATKRAFTTNLHYNTKNIWLCKKIKQKQTSFSNFLSTFLFPFSQLFIYKYATVKKLRFHRSKAAKKRRKKHIYLINIIHKCLKMYKLHYLI